MAVYFLSAVFILYALHILFLGQTLRPLSPFLGFPGCFLSGAICWRFFLYNKIRLNYLTKKVKEVPSLEISALYIAIIVSNSFQSHPRYCDAFSNEGPHLPHRENISFLAAEEKAPLNTNSLFSALILSRRNKFNFEHSLREK